MCRYREFLYYHPNPHNAHAIPFKNFGCKKLLRSPFARDKGVCYRQKENLSSEDTKKPIVLFTDLF